MRHKQWLDFPLLWTMGNVRDAGLCCSLELCITCHACHVFIQGQALDGEERKDVGWRVGGREKRDGFPGWCLYRLAEQQPLCPLLSALINQPTQLGWFQLVFLCEAFYNLCEFWKTPLMNGHKLGRLKQQTVILLLFWRPEIQSPLFSGSSRRGDLLAPSSFW